MHSIVFSGYARLAGLPACCHRVIRGHRLSRPSLLRAIPCVELAVAVLVFLPWRLPVEIGCLLASALLSVFTAAIGHAVRNRDTVRCHCFGDNGEAVSAVTIVRNIIFLTTASLGGIVSIMGVTCVPKVSNVLGWSGPAVAAVFILANLEVVTRMLQRPLDS